MNNFRELNFGKPLVVALLQKDRQQSTITVLNSLHLIVFSTFINTKHLFNLMLLGDKTSVMMVSFIQRAGEEFS